MLKKTISTLAIGSLILIFVGCGGGSQGTGGQIYKGFVIGTDTTPVSGATVNLVETGDSVVTDENGEFSISTSRLSGDIEFVIMTGDFSASAIALSVPADAIEIEVEIEVELDGEHRTSTSVTVKRRRGGGSEGAEDDNINSNTDDTQSDDGDRNHRNGNNSRNEDRSGDSSGGDSSNNQDDGEQDMSDDSDGQFDQPGEGEDVDAEGLISAFSSTLLIVNGTSFTLDSQTEYRDEDGRNSNSSILAVGLSVKVKGRTKNSVLVAERVEIED